MQVGDLIIDDRYPQDGHALILGIREHRTHRYQLFCLYNGAIDWFPTKYVENFCVVVKK